MSSSEPFLVELAATLLKCRKLFLSVFTAVLALGMGHQLFATPQYQSVTLIKLAQNGDGDLLEPGEGVIASLENQWLPQVIRAYHDENGQLPGARLSIREASRGYVQVSSVGNKHLAAETKQLHAVLAEKVIASQLTLERSARAKLKTQLEMAERLVDALKATGSLDSSGAGFLETLISLKGKLAGMQSAEIRVIAQQKDEVAGLGSALRVALTLLQAFVAAVAVVLFYCFILRVRRVVRRQEQQ